MNIYVQDDLGEQVKQAGDINVSAVCQEALRRELDRRKLHKQLGDDMKRIEFDASESHGGTVVFTGAEIADTEVEYAGAIAYLTPHKRIAVTVTATGALDVYESFDEFAAAWNGHASFVNEAATALGEQHVIELDI